MTGARSARTTALRLRFGVVFMVSIAGPGVFVGPAAHAQDPTVLAVITGTVQSRDSGEPVANALVEVHPLDDPESTLGTVRSDTAGRFRLEGYPPGGYRAVVRAAGFVRQPYGARHIGGSGTVVRLSAGEETELRFLLTRAATISGRVRDSAAEPLPAMIVEAWRERYSEDGSRRLERAQSGRTDDLGEYRLFGLDPDAYLISVDVPGTPVTRPGTYPNIAPSGLHAPVFYPGVLDREEAVRVEVGAGQVRSGVDIRAAEARTASIRGRLVGMALETRASVGLIPAELAGPGMARMVETGDDGSFVFPDIAPGSYELMLLPGRSALSVQVSSLPVEVFGEDLEVTLPVLADSAGTISNAESVSFSIRVVLDEADPAVDLSSLPVQLVGLDRGTSTHGTRPMENEHGVRVVRETAGVRPGRYRVDVRAYAGADAPYLDAYYVKRMTFDNRAVIGDVIEVLEPGTRLDILLGSDGATVEGIVADADGPYFDARIVLVPEGPDRDSPRLFRSVTADESGYFHVSAVAPGAYRILAFERLEPYGYFDPVLRARIESEGARVEIREGDAVRIAPEVVLAEGP